MLMFYCLIFFVEYDPAVIKCTIFGLVNVALSNNAYMYMQNSLYRFLVRPTTIGSFYAARGG